MTPTKIIYTAKSGQQYVGCSKRHFYRILEALGFRPTQIELPSGAHQSFYIFSAKQIQEIKYEWEHRVKFTMKKYKGRGPRLCVTS